MDLSNWGSALVTIAITCIASFITIKTLMAEMRKDIEFLKSQLLQYSVQRAEDLNGLKKTMETMIIDRKNDMHEMKMDLKTMGENVTNIRVLMAEQNHKP